MLDFTSFIVESNLIIVTVIFALGMVIKSMNMIRDEFIPVILMMVGITFSIAQNGINVQSVYQGILTAAAAVFTHQLIKQFNELGKEK